LAFDLVITVWWDYSFSVSTTPYPHDLSYNFDTDTIQFPQEKSPYTSLLVYISESRDPSTYDRYKVSLSVISPKITKLIAWSGSQSSFWEASMRIEPCGNPVLINSHHEITVSLDQGIQSNQVYVRRFVSLVLEETLIPELPYSTYIVGDGLKRYRTVQMTQPGYLMISFTSNNEAIDVSNVITQVILATGNQCIENYDPNSEYRIAKMVPERVINYTITVPATDIWYIAFVTTGQPGEITVEFMAVDILPNNTLPDIILPDTPDTPFPPGPNFIPRDPLMDTSDPSNSLILWILIAVLLFILIGIMIVYICVFPGHDNFMNWCSDSKKEVSLDYLKV
jgi:hypothetical protein